MQNQELQFLDQKKCHIDGFHIEKQNLQWRCLQCNSEKSATSLSKKRNWVCLVMVPFCCATMLSHIQFCLCVYSSHRVLQFAGPSFVLNIFSAKFVSRVSVSPYVSPFLSMTHSTVIEYAIQYSRSAPSFRCVNNFISEFTSRRNLVVYKILLLKKL